MFSTAERPQKFVGNNNVAGIRQRNLPNSRTFEISRESFLFLKKRVWLFCHHLPHDPLMAFSVGRKLPEVLDECRFKSSNINLRILQCQNQLFSDRRVQAIAETNGSFELLTPT